MCGRYYEDDKTAREIASAVGGNITLHRGIILAKYNSAKNYGRRSMGKYRQSGRLQYLPRRRKGMQGFYP